jgi:hypothetical protein
MALRPLYTSFCLSPTSHGYLQSPLLRDYQAASMQNPPLEIPSIVEPEPTALDAFKGLERASLDFAYSLDARDIQCLRVYRGKDCGIRCKSNIPLYLVIRWFPRPNDFNELSDAISITAHSRSSLHPTFMHLCIEAAKKIHPLSKERPHNITRWLPLEWHNPDIPGIEVQFKANSHIQMLPLVVSQSSPKRHSKENITG